MAKKKTYGNGSYGTIAGYLEKRRDKVKGATATYKEDAPVSTSEIYDMWKKRREAETGTSRAAQRRDEGYSVSRDLVDRVASTPTSTSDQNTRNIMDESMDRMRNRASMANGVEDVSTAPRNSNNGPMTVSRDLVNRVAAQGKYDQRETIERNKAIARQNANLVRENNRADAIRTAAREERERLGINQNEISAAALEQIKRLRNGDGTTLSNRVEADPVVQDTARNTREYQWARRHPLEATAVSVFTNPITGVEGLINVGRQLADKDKINPNDMRGTMFQDALRQGITRGTKDNLSNIGLDTADDGRVTTAEKVSDFLVGTGIDALNSTAGGLMLGAANVAAMSGNAASRALYEGARDEEQTRDQMVATAVANGAFEYIFERVSLDNLIKNNLNPTSFRDLLKNYLKSAFVEGSEEFNTDIANDIADGIINRGNSEAGKLYNNLLLQGVPVQDAVREVIRDRLLNAGISFLGGSLSGGVSALGGGLYGTLRNAQNLQEIAPTRDLERRMYNDIAAETDESSDLGKMSRDYANRLNDGGNTNIFEKGFYANAMDAASEGATYDPAYVDNSIELAPGEEATYTRGEMVFEPDNSLADVLAPETSENVVQETTQQQVSDIVNAAVDTLLSERGIENTSESTPDEAKNLTEIAVNELNSQAAAEEAVPEVAEDDVQKNAHEEPEPVVSRENETVEQHSTPAAAENDTVEGPVSSDTLRDNLSRYTKFTSDGFEYEIKKNINGDYKGYIRDISGNLMGGAISDARALRYETGKKRSYEEAVDEIVRVAQNNGFTSDKVNSNDKLQQIAEETVDKTPEPAAETTESNTKVDFDAELDRRAKVRFPQDPDAQNLYNAGFNEFADKIGVHNEPMSIITSYDDNMAKAYQAGLSGSPISSLNNDKMFRNFDELFPNLTNTMYELGYNKSTKGNAPGGNVNEESDINRESGTGQTEPGILGSEGQVSDGGTVGRGGNDEVRQGTSGGYDTVHSEETDYDGEGENIVRPSEESQRESEGSVYQSDESGDERGSGAGVRERNEVRDNEQRSQIKETSDEAAEEQVEQKDEVVTQEQPKGNNFVLTPEFAKNIPKTSAKRRDANIEAAKTLAKIMEEDRIATPEEQEILARFTGWGGVSDADLDKAIEKLTGILSEDALEDARHEKIAAYYTSPEIIEAMYKGIAGLGFKGGRMLEPSCGTGRFIGCMPSEMIPSVKRWTATELSDVPGNIARLLYPNADVRVQGFETVNILDNFNDVVIGNVPFGAGNLYGKDYPSYVYSRLENYFIARSLDKTRPGGLCVLIAGSTILDNGNENFRKYIKTKADFLGAIRLPNNTFGDTGTDVVSDILVFKKRAEGMPYEGEDFVGRSSIPSNYDLINEYFVKHPSMLLGEYVRSDRNSRSFTLAPTKGNLSTKIEKAFSKINGRMEYNERDYEVERERREARNKKQGTAYSKDGQLYINDNGEEKLLKNKKNLTEKDLSLYSHAMEIRDTAKALLKAQREGQADNVIEDLRKTLNEQYDAFLKESKQGNYAGFHKPSVQKLLADDTDYSFLQSLEKVSTKNGKTVIEKAPIFFRNTLNNPTEITHVNTLPEGIEASLGRVGYIDTNVISELMGKDAAAIEEDLDKGELAFRDANYNFVPANLYLSGNVRAKLKEAEVLAESDKKYEKNVEALKAVQPEFVHGDKIKAHVGSTWIPDAYYSQFIAHIMGCRENDIIIHHVANAGYSVWADSSVLNSADNKSTWGNSDMHFLYENQNSPGLLWRILNNYNIEVTSTYKDPDGKTHTIHNEKAEAELRQLKSKLNDELNTWLWEDETRKNQLETLFNDSYNSNVEAHFNDQVTLRGQSPDITLRSHQKRLVNRVAFSPYNTLAQHGVGAGKTFGAIAALMKMKQLGMISKPVIVVPKNKIADWANDFYKLFPGANLLMADSNTFVESKRREFVNKIATNDCDAVIISYEQFKMLPMTPEKRLEYNRRELKKIMETAEQENLKTESKKNKAGEVKTTFKNTTKTTRQLQTLKDRLEKEIKKLESFKKDDTSVFFEETGIDYICVDEAQNYKNLMYYSNLTGVADMGNPTGSQRAKDMKMKTDYIRSVNKGKGVLLLTATPIMNSPVEAYTMLRYLGDEELEKKGIRTLDDFVSMFGEIEDITRMDNAGRKWTTKTSFTGFCNIPQWQTLWRTYVDRVKTEDVEGIKLPAKKEEVIKCEAGPLARQMINGLSDRLTNRSTKGRNHIFAIQSDGKKASFTQRFFNESLPYGPNEKVVKTVDEVVKEYNATKTFKDWDGNVQENGVQLIFCDFGTPKSQAEIDKETEQQKKLAKKKTVTDGEEEFVADDDVYNPNSIENEKELRGNLNIYKDMKEMLVKRGIPADQIAFIQDAKGNVNKQEKLYDDVKAGRVRVLIGSTMTMAEGLNVQDRITCMHLMNPFLRPGDKEQAIGRGRRQHNMNPEVKIKIYVTEDTFDTKQWDTTNAKERFINQIQDGTADAASVRMEYSDDVMSTEDIMAIASGNPLLKTQSKTNDRLRTLDNLKSAYHSKIYKANQQIQSLQRDNVRLTELIENVNKDIKTAKDISGDKFKAVVAGKPIIDRAKFGTELLKLVIKYNEDNADISYFNMPSRILGNIAGFNIVADGNVYWGTLSLVGEHTAEIDIPRENGEISMDKPAGMATRFQNAIKNFSKEITDAEETIKENEENIKKYKAELEKPFEQQEELDKVSQLSADIETALKTNDETTYDDLNNRFAELKDEYRFMARGKGKGSKKTDSKGNFNDDNRRELFEESLHKEEFEAEKNEGSNAEVRPLDDILADYAHRFGFNYTSGSRYVKGAKEGSFNLRDKGIRTKVTNQLPAFSHEFGHWLADKYKIEGSNKQLPAEVKIEAKQAFARALSDEDYKKEQVIDEGIAEFIRYYCTNKDTARIDYPKMSDYILSQLSPKDLADFQAMADSINAVLVAGAEDMTQHTVLHENRNPDFRTKKEILRDQWHHAYQMLVDSNHSLRLLDRQYGSNTHTYATNAEYADSRIEYALTDSLYDFEGHYVCPGLKPILSGININDPEEYEAFGDYLVLVHAPERLALGKRTFADDRQNNEIWLKQQADKILKKYPHFEKVAEQLYRFQRNVMLHYGVQQGLVSMDAFKAMQKDYKCYVPFFRAGFTTNGDSRKRAKGSGRTIVNPVDNIIVSTTKLMKAGMRNAILLNARNAAIRYGYDAMFMENIPAPKIPIKYDIKGIKDNLFDNAAFVLQGYNVDSEAVDLLQEVFDQIDDTLVQFQTGRANKSRNEISIMVKGEPEFWKINDPLLMDTLCSMDYKSSNALLNIYGKVTRFITNNLTGGNVKWSVFSNAPRDFQTFMYFTDNKNPAAAAKDIFDSWKNSWNDAHDKAVDDYYREFMAMGASGAPVWQGAESYVKDIRRILSNKKSFNPLAPLHFVSDTIELGPRYATYKFCREKGMTQQQAFYAAMEITTNFRRHGIVGKEMNKAFQFFNANLQGIDHAMRYYTAEDLKGTFKGISQEETAKRRGKAIVGRVSFLLAASIIGAMLNYLLNHRTKEDKEDYNKLSNYLKNTNFTFPLGDGKFFSIPKGHELLVPESFFERAIEYYFDKDDDALDEYYDYLFDNITPPIVSDMLKFPVNAVKKGMTPAIEDLAIGLLSGAGIAGVVAQEVANKNFLGNPIVYTNPYVKRPPKSEYNDRTSEMAYLIGQAFDVSPQHVDHFCENVLGWIWETQEALLPIDDKNGTKGKRDLTLGVGNVYIRDNLRSNDITNWIYDKSDESAMRYSDTKDNFLEMALDERMRSYYSNFNKASKRDIGTSEGRAAKREVLDELIAYKKGKVSPEAKKVYDLVEKTGEKKYLPTAQDDSIKNGTDEVQLTGSEYVQYQKTFEDYFYKLANESLDPEEDIEKQTYTVDQAEKTAKQLAMDEMLNQKGIESKDTSIPKAATWMNIEGADFDTFIDKSYDIKAIKEGSGETKDKQKKVRSEIAGLSPDMRELLWQMAGWKVSTLNK